MSRSWRPDPGTPGDLVALGDQVEAAFTDWQQCDHTDEDQDSRFYQAYLDLALEFKRRETLWMSGR